MKDWDFFYVGGKKREVKFCHLFSKLIVEAIGANLRKFLEIPLKKRKSRTEHIMDTLSEVGRKQGFKSLSHGISATLAKKKINGRNWFRKVEWLYDLHWYEENNKLHYQQTSLPLVVECEWDRLRDDDKSGDRYSAIKWDFQKLLVANADLRVLIFQLRDKDGQFLNKKLDEYFTETITGYRNLPVGSKFLFVAFDKNGFWYSEKIKT